MTCSLIMFSSPACMEALKVIGSHTPGDLDHMCLYGRLRCHTTEQIIHLFSTASLNISKLCPVALTQSFDESEVSMRIMARHTEQRMCWHFILVSMEGNKAWPVQERVSGSGDDY